MKNWYNISKICDKRYMKNYYLIHNKVSGKWEWYKQWHEKRYANLVHVFFLFLFSLMSLLIILGTVYLPAFQEVKAQSGGGRKISSLMTDNLSRGLIAVPRGSEGVYVGWRLFKIEDPNLSFNVYRKSTGGSYSKIAEVSDSTNYLDSSAQLGNTYFYQIKPVMNGNEGLASEEVSVDNSSSKKYITIPTNLTDGANRIMVGDLDGDGVLDYIFITPFYDGERLNRAGLAACLSSMNYGECWTFNKGYGSMELNGDDWDLSHTHSTIVWDMDGDGKAEIVTKIIRDGTYYLAMIDGMTGQIKKETPYPTSHLTGNKNRNMLSPAYLSGGEPSIILQLGTYDGDHVVLNAYDKDLGLTWHRVGSDWWEGSTRTYAEYGIGQTGHGLFTIDYDGDGNDEILVGTTFVDENGERLWYVGSGWGHPDMMEPGDIDLDNPGFEVAYGTEAMWRARSSRIGLVDLNRGDILWEKQGFDHVHTPGYVANIRDDYPGLEIMSLSSDDHAGRPGQYPPLYSSKGELINTSWAHYGDVVLWDDDLKHDNQRVLGNVIAQISYQKPVFPFLVADVVGDYRDDVMQVVRNELRIYINTDLSIHKYPTPLQSRYYRESLARSAVGYYNSPRVLDPTCYFEEENCVYPYVALGNIKADLNCDGLIDIVDFGILLSYWETDGSAFTPGWCGRVPDIDGSGIVNGSDLGQVFSCWGIPEDDICFVNGVGGLGAECNVGDEETASCARCGTQTRTCLSNGQWGEWSDCIGQGICAAGSFKMAKCLTHKPTGTEGVDLWGFIKTECGENCQWESPGPCIAVCPPAEPGYPDFRGIPKTIGGMYAGCYLPTSTTEPPPEHAIQTDIMCYDPPPIDMHPTKRTVCYQCEEGYVWDGEKCAGGSQCMIGLNPRPYDPYGEQATVGLDDVIINLDDPNAVTSVVIKLYKSGSPVESGTCMYDTGRGGSPDVTTCTGATFVYDLVGEYDDLKIREQVNGAWEDWIDCPKVIVVENCPEAQLNTRNAGCHATELDLLTANVLIEYICPNDDETCYECKEGYRWDGSACVGGDEGNCHAQVGGVCYGEAFGDCRLESPGEDWYHAPAGDDSCSGENTCWCLDKDGGEYIDF